VLDQVIVYDRAHAPWTFIPFLNKIRAGRFDLVLDLQRHLKSGLASRISGARDRFGFSASNSKEFNHLFSNHQIPAQPNMRLKLLQYQAFGDALEIPPAPIEFGLAPSNQERDRAVRRWQKRRGRSSPLSSARRGRAESISRIDRCCDP